MYALTNREVARGKKKSSRIGTWLRRLFVNPSEEINRLAEEQIVSPGKQMFKSFLHNKIAMVGFTIFMASLLLVLIGPYFYPIDLSYSDSTQQNIAPGMNMMKVPKDILDDVKVIEPGSTFGFALTNPETSSIGARRTSPGRSILQTSQ